MLFCYRFLRLSGMSGMKLWLLGAPPYISLCPLRSSRAARRHSSMHSNSFQFELSLLGEAAHLAAGWGQVCLRHLVSVLLWACVALCDCWWLSLFHVQSSVDLLGSTRTSVHPAFFLHRVGFECMPLCLPPSLPALLLLIVLIIPLFCHAFLLHRVGFELIRIRKFIENTLMFSPSFSYSLTSLHQIQPKRPQKRPPSG